MIDILVPWYLRKARHPLKDKVVGRFWTWFSRRPWWITYDETLEFKVNLRDYVQQKVFYDGYYEPNLVAWLKGELRKDDVFWDVGANVGALSLIAAKHCQRVCAFEPEPRTRTHLEEHVLRNGLANVTVLPYALSSVDGFASLQLGPETNSGMNRLNPGSVAGRGAVEVQTARADSLVRANWIPGPDVMKIDVEGAEGLVLEGATEVLLAPKLRAVIFETPDNGHGMPSDQRLVELLGSSFRITPLGPSDPEVKNSMNNFVAVRTQS